LVAARRCHHTVVSTVELAEGAGLLWREELVCGRDGEESGSAAMEMRVRLAGRALCAQRTAVGPDAPGWDGAAVLGGARAVGGLLVVDPAWLATGPPPARTHSHTMAAMPLAGPAVLVSATGKDALALRRSLDDALGPLP
jgi:urease accessory protein